MKMNKSLSILLVILLIIPTMSGWLSHSAVHALHDHQSQHHNTEKSHDHGHEGHKHGGISQEAVHHPIHFDAVTYFTDYLHVDLQNPEQIVLKSPVFDTQDINFTVATVADSSLRQELIAVQSRAPPDNLRPWPSKNPLYFSTQRIRI